MDVPTRSRSRISTEVELAAVRKREQAELAIFLTLEEPTTAMEKQALAAEFYEPQFYPAVPGVQILTIKEVLEGKKADYPRIAPEETFKKAPKQTKEGPKQKSLL